MKNIQNICHVTIYNLIPFHKFISVFCVAQQLWRQCCSHSL